MIKGKLVSLHAIERDDLLKFRDWRNNPDFRKYFREYRELNMRHQEIWFEEKVVKDNTTLMFSIKRNSDGELLGCCGFVYINWVHRHADLSLYIGHNNVYIDDELALDTCDTLLMYGFHELSLNKVWTEIYEFDNKKLDLYNKFKFNQDGLLRENYWYNNRWWDSRILSILARDYKKQL